MYGRSWWPKVYLWDIYNHAAMVNGHQGGDGTQCKKCQHLLTTVYAIQLRPVKIIEIVARNSFPIGIRTTVDISPWCYHLLDICTWNRYKQNSIMAGIFNRGQYYRLCIPLICCSGANIGRLLRLLSFLLASLTLNSCHSKGFSMLLVLSVHGCGHAAARHAVLNPNVLKVWI